jgi:hypothetical protein
LQHERIQLSAVLLGDHLPAGHRLMPATARSVASGLDR